MIYLLILLSSCLLLYLIYFHYMIFSLTKKLKHRNAIQTNMTIELPTKNPYLIKLVIEIIELIKINQKSYQQMVETQQQFDMAINNISHDIRTPLTVASGYTQILAREVDAKQGNLVAKISLNLTDVEKKLDDLLTYNRLLENKIPVNLEEINVSSLLESKVVNYFEAFKKETIELNLGIDKNVSIISDQEILNRIIENALGNILNHGSKEGNIYLTKEAQEIKLVFSNYTNQRISDYNQLFNRFYTEDLSRVNKNSGLGLYIIKELTALLNGTVEASGNDDYFELKINIPYQ